MPHHRGVTEYPGQGSAPQHWVGNSHLAPAHHSGAGSTGSDTNTVSEDSSAGSRDPGAGSADLGIGSED